MLAGISRFFRDHLQAGPDDTGDRPDPLALATAALMFEVMRADATLDDREQAHVRELLQSRFGLQGEALDTLAALAEEEAEQATDLYQFTALVNDHYGPEERIALIRNMWSVAWADGEIDRFEDHLIRRVAELLHVRHRDFIAAKLEARPAGT
ncbi:MAG TPA: TerB family tellurite resistance protein [Pseudomonadales bacterium]|nr:TerB family tellurite resistance protein [Pseudomonadales bacterium]